MLKTILINAAFVAEMQVTKTNSKGEDLNTSLSARLKDGPVHFAFKKNDGSMREAFGTLNADLLPPPLPGVIGDAAKPVKEPSPNLQVYYDLGARSWRSFTKANLICIY